MARETKAKAGKTPEKEDWVATSNKIARAIWTTAYREANPDSSKETVDAAWSEVAVTYRKTVKTTLLRLARKGITFSASKELTEEEIAE